MPDVADADYCYLTTTGRVSGRPHTVELWFVLVGSIVYMIHDGPPADWIRNILRSPEVAIRLGSRDAEDVAGRGRLPADESDEVARAQELLLEKYQARYGGDLDEWARTGVVVAVDLPH